MKLERSIATTARPRKPVCVVGIGAAAGRREALTALLSGLPSDTGMAFVIVLQQAAGEPAELAEALGRASPIPVAVATHEALLEPDHVYLVPPGGAPAYADGRLLQAASPSPGPHLPIDAFFRSLALGRRSRAVGVILSGPGTDGALGVRAIREAGGISFAQDPRSARFDAMPIAAAGTGAGHVDFVLPPEQIAAELGSLAERLRAPAGKASAALPELEDDLVARVVALLRAAHDVDFTIYRQTTLKRRILRRMILGKVPTLAGYLGLLREQPAEVETLHQDLLVKVAHFFRDPDVFAALQQHVLPALVAARQGDAPLRIWVPGCATGEEAYSLAIALLEVISAERAAVPFQIFATDLSEAALETARTGAYLENIAMDVSPERLQRFFVREGARYQIAKSIRDNCLFARHDLARDVPFSRLDLVSCRNVLVYLETALQQQIVPVFHYALKPSGYLVLGASETVAGLSDLFSTVDKKRRIYARHVSVPRERTERADPVERAGAAARADPRRARRHAERASSAAHAAERAATVVDAQREADRLVMERYAPPGVVIDADLSIVQFRGQVGPYLELAPGEASLNLLKMARRGLAIELRAAIHEARRTGAAAQVERILRSAEGPPRTIGVEVIPISMPTGIAAPSPSAGWSLVLFHEREAEPPAARAAGRRGRTAEDARVTALERELAAARGYLQVTLEEQEATNEELQSTNEELLSSNEELQSINEELEMAAEEQQASNEELDALNQELRYRNGELTRATSDFGNLLSSVDIPMVMLTRDLRIRCFTPPAERALHLIPSDVGRPLRDINPRIDAPDLERLLVDVIDTASILEREVRDPDGRWYSMRIRPYRTTDNAVDGAVIVLVDIDQIRRRRLAETAPTGDATG